MVVNRKPVNALQTLIAFREKEDRLRRERALEIAAQLAKKVP